jgi:hypothetical protein
MTKSFIYKIPVIGIIVSPTEYERLETNTNGPISHAKAYVEEVGYVFNFLA